MLAVCLDDPDLPRQHPQLLKVDEPVHPRLVPVVEEGEILLDDGEEGNDGRGSATLELAILGHIVERVHETG